MGISRKFAADAIALASLPKDVFERELARDDVKPSARRLVNLAKNLPPNHRPGLPLTEATRAALQLSRADRMSLCIAILDANDAAEVNARLFSLTRRA